MSAADLKRNAFTQSCKHEMKPKEINEIGPLLSHIPIGHKQQTDDWNFNFFKNEEDQMFVKYLLGHFTIDEFVEVRNFRSVQKKIMEQNKASNAMVKNISFSNIKGTNYKEKYHIDSVPDNKIATEKDLVQFYKKIGDNQGRNKTDTSFVKNELKDLVKNIKVDYLFKDPRQDLFKSTEAMKYTGWAQCKHFLIQRFKAKNKRLQNECMESFKFFKHLKQASEELVEKLEKNNMLNLRDIDPEANQKVVKLKNFTIKGDYDPNAAKFSSTKKRGVEDQFGKEHLYKQMALHILDSSNVAVSKFREIFINMVDNYYEYLRPGTPKNQQSKPLTQKNKTENLKTQQSLTNRSMKIFFKNQHHLGDGTKSFNCLDTFCDRENSVGSKKQNTDPNHKMHISSYMDTCLSAHEIKYIGEMREKLGMNIEKPQKGRTVLKGGHICKKCTDITDLMNEEMIANHKCKDKKNCIFVPKNQTFKLSAKPKKETTKTFEEDKQKPHSPDSKKSLSKKDTKTERKDHFDKKDVQHRKSLRSTMRGNFFVEDNSFSPDKKLGGLLSKIHPKQSSDTRLTTITENKFVTPNKLPMKSSFNMRNNKTSLNHTRKDLKFVRNSGLFSKIKSYKNQENKTCRLANTKKQDVIFNYNYAAKYKKQNQDLMKNYTVDESKLNQNEISRFQSHKNCMPSNNKLLQNISSARLASKNERSGSENGIETFKQQTFTQKVKEVDNKQEAELYFYYKDKQFYNYLQSEINPASKMGKHYKKHLQELDAKNKPIVGQEQILLDNINNYERQDKNPLEGLTKNGSKGDGNIPLICPGWHIFKEVDKNNIRKNQKREILNEYRDKTGSWIVKRNVYDETNLKKNSDKPHKKNGHTTNRNTNEKANCHNNNENGFHIENNDTKHVCGYIISDDSSDYSFTEQRLNNMYKEANVIKTDVLQTKDKSNNTFLFKKNIDSCQKLDEITQNVMKINRARLNKNV